MFRVYETNGMDDYQYMDVATKEEARAECAKKNSVIMKINKMLTKVELPIYKKRFFFEKLNNFPPKR